MTIVTAPMREVISHKHWKTYLNLIPRRIYTSTESSEHKKNCVIATGTCFSVFYIET